MSNILIVTHTFLIKTMIYLFDFEHIEKISKINNTDCIRLVSDGEVSKVMCVYPNAKEKAKWTLF